MRSRRSGKLGRLLAYVLGLHPDAFGLVPDADGYVKVSDLLKALHEEEGLGAVRRADLNEILLTVENPPIEIDGGRIRAAERGRLPQPDVAADAPKLLYTAVRRRAHAHVFAKGIFPMGRRRVILAATPEMALRIGGRMDAQPVLLTVHVEKCEKMGLVFQRYGALLLSSKPIPVGAFTGPPVPKTEPAPPKPAKEPAPQPPTPGSFFLDPAADKKPGAAAKKAGRKKDVAWKKERRQRKRR